MHMNRDESPATSTSSTTALLLRPPLHIWTTLTTTSGATADESSSSSTDALPQLHEVILLHHQGIDHHSSSPVVENWAKRFDSLITTTAVDGGQQQQHANAKSDVDGNTSGDGVYSTLPVWLSELQRRHEGVEAKAENVSVFAQRNPTVYDEAARYAVDILRLASWMEAEYIDKEETERQQQRRSQQQSPKAASLLLTTQEKLKQWPEENDGNADGQQQQQEQENEETSLSSSSPADGEGLMGSGDLPVSPKLKKLEDGASQQEGDVVIEEDRKELLTAAGNDSNGKPPSSPPSLTASPAEEALGNSTSSSLAAKKAPSSSKKQQQAPSSSPTVAPPLSPVDRARSMIERSSALFVLSMYIYALPLTNHRIGASPGDLWKTLSLKRLLQVAAVEVNSIFPSAFIGRVATQFAEQCSKTKVFDSLAKQLALRIGPWLGAIWGPLLMENRENRIVVDPAPMCRALAQCRAAAETTLGLFPGAPVDPPQSRLMDRASAARSVATLSATITRRARHVNFAARGLPNLKSFRSRPRSPPPEAAVIAPDVVAAAVARRNSVLTALPSSAASSESKKDVADASAATKQKDDAAAAATGAAAAAQVVTAADDVSSLIAGSPSREMLFEDVPMIEDYDEDDDGDRGDGGGGGDADANANAQATSADHQKANGNSKQQQKPTTTDGNGSGSADPVADLSQQNSAMRASRAALDKALREEELNILSVDFLDRFKPPSRGVVMVQKLKDLLTERKGDTAALSLRYLLPAQVYSIISSAVRRGVNLASVAQVRSVGAKLFRESGLLISAPTLSRFIDALARLEKQRHNSLADVLAALDVQVGRGVSQSVVSIEQALKQLEQQSNGDDVVHNVPSLVRFAMHAGFDTMGAAGTTLTSSGSSAAPPASQLDGHEADIASSLLQASTRSFTPAALVVALQHAVFRAHSTATDEVQQQKKRKAAALQEQQQQEERSPLSSPLTSPKAVLGTDEKRPYGKSPLLMNAGVAPFSSSSPPPCVSMSPLPSRTSVRRSFRSALPRVASAAAPRGGGGGVCCCGGNRPQMFDERLPCEFSAFPVAGQFRRPLVLRRTAAKSGVHPSALSRNVKAPSVAYEMIPDGLQLTPTIDSVAPRATVEHVAMRRQLKTSMNCVQLAEAVPAEVPAGSAGDAIRAIQRGAETAAGVRAIQSLHNDANLRLGAPTNVQELRSCAYLECDALSQPTFRSFVFAVSVLDETHRAWRRTLRKIRRDAPISLDSAL